MGVVKVERTGKNGEFSEHGEMTSKMPNGNIAAILRDLWERVG